MPAPSQPKIYHIVHVDRLASIVRDGYLFSDATMVARQGVGTAIGMSDIKARRLNELCLSCHPNLRVGCCTPFYFCPRSIMLFLIHKRNEKLAYKDGQELIIHLEADLHSTIAWANQNHLRWAFTLSNAGARYFEVRADITRLNDIDWEAVQAKQWSGPTVPETVKEGKQAEFLIEQRLSWHLIERIGVYSNEIGIRASNAMLNIPHRPLIEVKREWYY